MLSVLSASLGLVSLAPARPAPAGAAAVRSAVRMADDEFPQKSVFDPSIFEDVPPPSWASDEWKWGSADGAAHEVAERVRGELEMPHRRQVLLSYARMGNVDFFDLKMALALKCQRARNMGYDNADGRWGSLMEAIAACEFEDADRGDELLIAAINERLPEPVDPAGNGGMAAVVAEALALLDFATKGI